MVKKQFTGECATAAYFYLCTVYTCVDKQTYPIENEYLLQIFGNKNRRM